MTCNRTRLQGAWPKYRCNNNSVLTKSRYCSLHCIRERQECVSQAEVEGSTDCSCNRPPVGALAHDWSPFVLRKYALQRSSAPDCTVVKVASPRPLCRDANLSRVGRL